MVYKPSFGKAFEQRLLCTNTVQSRCKQLQHPGRAKSVLLIRQSGLVMYRHFTGHRFRINTAT